jgi:putative CocE/NonD family hydrolase
MKMERNVEMHTRDGVTLRSDVYRPDGTGPFPVLMVRTPYGKQGYDGDRLYDFERMAGAGYIVVCQDVRGRHASDGHWESFMQPGEPEVDDGYDAVEWAARLPGSSGRVGTYGASYDGFVQWRMAQSQPPSLGATSAQEIPARYLDLEGPGTIRPGKRLHWWITKMAAEYRRRSGAPGTRLRSEGEAAWDGGEGRTWLTFLPWSDLPRAAFEDDTDAIQAWLRAPHTDPWKLDEGMRRIVTPNLDFTGWYDHAGGEQGTWKALVANGGSETARTRSRIVIGPWSHNCYVQDDFGAVSFGGAGLFDGVGEMVRWFDYWLKGIANGAEDDPRVMYFVMGDNAWRKADAWPEPRSHDLAWYTSSGGHANTPRGDGVLARERPAATGADRYTYDPRNPVPDMYAPGRISMPTDQRGVAGRLDILVFQSEPLTERIEVTGAPVVELTACSSAPDTDFFARLIDVHPDGLARDVSTGLVRTRYRDGVDRPSLVPAGAQMAYRITMSATSNAFLPGHRIRLDITSSLFPSYDRNHNTAADQNSDAELRTADQTIVHGGDAPTRLVLPWIPNGEV